MKNKKIVKHSPKPPSRQVKKTLHRKVRSQMPRHKRFLAHPATVFMLLCTGVLIAGWTRLSHADNINVTAMVLAPPLSQGAVITNPVEGEVLTTSPISVHGTCPPNSYVNLSRNGAFSGSAFCAANQTFDIQTSLFTGTNALTAQDYNITNQPGPVTPSVHVTYNPPAPLITPPTVVKKLQNLAKPVRSSGQLAVSNLPFLLTSDYKFKSFVRGDNFEWSISAQGGNSPYVLQIDWNDGNHSVLKFGSGTTVTITHRYLKAGYFPVKIHATDTKGQQADLQIAALIRQPGAGFVVGSSGANPASGGMNFFQRTQRWLWLIWPTYGVVILMAISYLLGERQELHNLLDRRYSHRH